MRSSEDIALVNRLLSGDETAATEFRTEFYPFLCAALKARCSDVRSKTKAEETAADVIADCFGANGSKSLLSRYDGTSSLRAWFFLVGLNRLKSWWRSAHWRYERPGTEVDEYDTMQQPGESNPLQDGPNDDSDVAAIIGRALKVAFRFIDSKDLAFLRCVYISGFTQQEVAEKWDCNVSTVSRHLEATAKRLHEKVIRYVEILDPDLEITWEDCIAMCAKRSEFLKADEADEADEAETIKPMQARLVAQMEKTGDPALQARDDRAAVDKVLLATSGPPKARKEKKAIEKKKAKN